MRHKIDLVSEHARERLGMPEGWEGYHFAWMPSGAKNPTHIMVRGAVAPLITRGPNKGRKNWKKRDPDTDLDDLISREEQDAYDAAWSAKTGLCLGCMGRGETFKEWSKANGTKMAPCRKCGGTGKAKGVTIDGPPPRPADLPGQLTMFGREDV